MKKIIYLAVFAFFVAGLPISGAYAAPINQGKNTAECDYFFLTLPSWYNGLSYKVDGECEIIDPSGSDDAMQQFVTLVALNVINMLTQMVAYASVAFLMVGGFSYMTSAGSPEGMKSALKTITNAIIGLVIAIFAVTIVNLIAASLG